MTELASKKILSMLFCVFIRVGSDEAVRCVDWKNNKFKVIWIKETNVKRCFYDEDQRCFFVEVENEAEFFLRFCETYKKVFGFDKIRIFDKFDMFKPWIKDRNRLNDFIFVDEKKNEISQEIKRKLVKGDKRLVGLRHNKKYKMVGDDGGVGGVEYRQWVDMYGVLEKNIREVISYDFNEMQPFEAFRLDESTLKSEYKFLRDRIISLFNKDSSLVVGPDEVYKAFTCGGYLKLIESLKRKLEDYKYLRGVIFGGGDFYTDNFFTKLINYSDEFLGVEETAVIRKFKEKYKDVKNIIRKDIINGIVINNKYIITKNNTLFVMVKSKNGKSDMFKRAVSLKPYHLYGKKSIVNPKFANNYKSRYLLRIDEDIMGIREINRIIHHWDRELFNISLDDILEKVDDFCVGGEVFLGSKDRRYLLFSREMEGDFDSWNVEVKEENLEFCILGFVNDFKF